MALSENPMRPNNNATPFRERYLLSPWMLAGVWIPIAVITLFHYLTPHQYQWVHDILRRTYYIPIVIAAVRTGLWRGLIGAAVVTVAYLPHAFLAEHHFDPARGLEKSLEIVLYFIVAAIAGTLSDKEQKRRLELQNALEEQRRLSDQLVRAGRLSALGEVVAGIAHEIKNPLHAMAGTTEIVDPLIPKDADERPMWEIHKQEIQRLGRVATRFLSFARPTPIEPVSIDLRNVAKRLVDLVGAEARQKNIQIQTDIDRETMVRGDLDQLAQVGLNIALNGIRAMESAGDRMAVSVGLGYYRDQSMAFLRIENNGQQLDEKDFENLFNPFYSRHDSTGLGLAISTRIAEQHRGYIEAENAGLGVSFTLYLPPDNPQLRHDKNP
jgi:signal transduction histidine kinase